MTEIWKDILGYEGIYQVSSYGQVRSLDRLSRDGRRLQGRILKQTLDKDGYYTVTLYDITGKVKNVKQHRLVAISYLENPDHKPHVNHLNGIKVANFVENLEWASCQENNQHQRDTGLKKVNKVQVFKDGNLVTILDGKQGQISFGLDPSSVSKCLLGKRATHKGYTFKLLEGNTND